MSTSTSIKPKKRGLLDSIKFWGGKSVSPQEKARVQYEQLLIKAQQEQLRLQGTAYVNPTPFKELLESAKDLADTKDFIQAHRTLQGFKKKAGELRAEAKIAREQALANTAAEVEYLAEVEKLEKVIIALATLPGTGAVREEISQKLQKAEKKASAKNFTGAASELTGLLAKASKAQKESKTAVGKVMADPKVAEAKRLVETAIAKLVPPLAQPDYQAEQRAAMTKILDEYLTAVGTAKTPPPTAVTTAEKKLTTLADDLEKQLEALTLRHQECHNQRDLVERKLNLLIGNLPTEVLQNAQEDFKEADIIFQESRFKFALKKFKVLEKTLDGLFKANPQVPRDSADAEKKWKKTQLVRTRVRTECQDLIKTEKTKARGEFNQRWLDKIIELGDTRKDFGLAMVELEKLDSKSKLDTKYLKGYLALEEDRKKGVQVIGPLLTQAKEGLTALRERFTQRKITGENAEAVLADFQNQITTLENDWTSRLENASSPTELAVAATQGDLKAIIKALTKASKSRTARRELLKGAAAEKDRKTLETTLEAIQKDLEALEEFAVDALDAYAGRLARLRNGQPHPRKGYAILQRNANALQNDVSSDLSTARSEQTTALNNLNTKITQVQTAIKNLEKTAGRNAKDLEPFFESLSEELTDLQTIATSTNKEIQAQTDTALDNLLQRIEAAKTDVVKPNAGKSVLNQSAALVKELTRQVSTHKNMLKYKPTRHRELTEKLTGIKDKIPSQSPTDTMLALQTFETTDLKEAIDELKVVLNNVTAFNTILTQVKGREKQLRRLKPQPKEYLKSVQDKIKAAQTELEIEGKSETALTNLKTLNDEVAKLLAGGGSAVADKERQIQESQATAEREKLRFEESMTAFKNGLFKEAKKKLKETSGADKGQLRDVQTAINEANKQAKTGNIEGAKLKLEAAQTLAQRAINNPKGFKKAARGQLQKLAPRWRLAVKTFRDSIKDIRSKISAEGKGEIDNQVIKTAGTNLHALGTLFNPGAFDKPLETMLNKAAKVQERRGARENALRLVREYRTSIETDPLILHLRTCPFGMPALTPIAAALNDLELNALRGI